MAPTRVAGALIFGLGNFGKIRASGSAPGELPFRSVRFA
jgi:hypothetical protein